MSTTLVPSIFELPCAIGKRRLRLALYDLCNKEKVHRKILHLILPSITEENIS
jgi:hypothetical protein